MVDGDELGAVGKRGLDLDVMDHLGDAIHALRAGDDMGAGLFKARSDRQVGFLIEAAGCRVLYTGDLRLHGRKPGMTAGLIKAATAAPLDQDLAPLPDAAPETLRHLARQALEGNADAAHDLGTLYAIGTDLPQDYGRAALWYRRAAAAGVANAVYNLGVLTERGLGWEAVATELSRRHGTSGHAEKAARNQ